MGYDCICHLPEGTKFNDVEEFLGFLGFGRQEKGEFYFFKETDYLSISGVWAFIKKDAGDILVFLRSSIFASKTDIDHFNLTAKQLRNRFGGYFESDFGKGRYLRVNAPDLKQAEAGCYHAYSHFENNLSVLYVYLSHATFDIDFPPLGVFPDIDKINPKIVSNNILIPFLVSVVEEFFKSCYVALLKYSPRKKSILKRPRLDADDLINVSNGEMTIEEAIAKNKSFQNVRSIVANFKEVNPDLDLFGVLSKPYRRRKETLYESLRKIFEHRHLIIHRNIIRHDYTESKLKFDIHNTTVVVERAYDHFIDKYGWQEK